MPDLNFPISAKAAGDQTGCLHSVQRRRILALSLDGRVRLCGQPSGQGNRSTSMDIPHD